MKPLALTMGEPAGIGGEITLKAWLMRHGKNLPAFVALDDPDRLRAEADRLEKRVPVQVIDSLDQVDDLFETALPVLPVHLKDPAEPGLLNAFHAGAVLESIQKAVQLALDDQVAAVVTNPIHKGILYEAGFNHPGHTEYLADLCGIDHEPIMMLMAQDLRVVPLTVHVPLNEVAPMISRELIHNKMKTIIKAFQQDLGIAMPRVAIAGLNPHAGEDGSIGDEELEVIVPALDELREEGYVIDGPLSADTMFHEEARENYDVAVCMYHDQALIPVKTLDFHGGVNVTLGLPIIRTSPDHGTALGIAGQGVARPDSLIAALKTAHHISKNK
ncbi:MAG: 4-hydroxythreonine-4-phosphate dehydrogenase PdxA [Pseudomonadota bacterium]